MRVSVDGCGPKGTLRLLHFLASRPLAQTLHRYVKQRNKIPMQQTSPTTPLAQLSDALIDITARAAPSIVAVKLQSNREVQSICACNG